MQELCSALYPRLQQPYQDLLHPHFILHCSMIPLKCWHMFILVCVIANYKLLKLSGQQRKVKLIPFDVLRCLLPSQELFSPGPVYNSNSYILIRKRLLGFML